jgi:hypothetical protein
MSVQDVVNMNAITVNGSATDFNHTQGMTPGTTIFP